MGKLTKKKAKKILRHGEVRGHTLTKKQKGLFGLIAGGGKPTRLKNSIIGGIRFIKN